MGHTKEWPASTAHAVSCFFSMTRGGSVVFLWLFAAMYSPYCFDWAAACAVAQLFVHAVVLIASVHQHVLHSISQKH